ncbi:MAG: hypothetical protein DHS80DRAFT_25517 [Piptocephalis tieghemiana]|nr:MAG: hypothetical protein DHS80DRAFT_25517 [Piptocephalis tieghemiana]
MKAFHAILTTLLLIYCCSCKAGTQEDPQIQAIKEQNNIKHAENIHSKILKKSFQDELAERSKLLRKFGLPFTLDEKGKPLMEAWRNTGKDRILTQDLGYYATGYDKHASMCRWSMVVFTKDQLTGVNYGREKRHFLQLKRHKKWDDIVLQLVSANPRLLDEENKAMIDRGHMASVADVAGILKDENQELLYEGTYFFDNIAPQPSKFNDGIWRVFEEVIRDMSKEMDNLWVISGPAFSDLESKFKVPFMPKNFFKVLLGIKGGKVYVGALNIPSAVTLERTSVEHWMSAQYQANELPKPVRESTKPLRSFSLGFQPFPNLIKQIGKGVLIEDIWEHFPWDKAIKERWDVLRIKQANPMHYSRGSVPRRAITSPSDAFSSPQRNGRIPPPEGSKVHTWTKKGSSKPGRSMT